MAEGGEGGEGGQPKIPEIVAKIEGRGNGIKTNISNCVEVSRIIKRHPAYLCKYMGVELGAQSTFNHDSGYAIVTGAHGNDKLQPVLVKFIRDFVTCPKCKGLQTKLSLDKKGTKVTMKCKGCGAKTKLDQTHKVIKEIIKYPPGSESEKKDKKDKKKEGKKARRQALKEDPGALPEDEPSAADDAAAAKPQPTGKADETEEERAARRKAEKEAKKAKKAEKAAKAAAKEARKAGGDRKKAMAAAPADGSMTPREGSMTPRPGDAAPEPEPEPAASEENMEEKLREAIAADGVAIAAGWWNGAAGDMPLQQALSTAFSVAFTGAEMIKQVKPTKRLFSKLCAKKEGQTIMFDLTLELARNDEAVMGKLGHYFKALYDEDLVEEEVIVECHGKLDQESAEAKASKSFVEWCVHEPPAILTPCPCRARA